MSQVEVCHCLKRYYVSHIQVHSRFILSNVMYHRFVNVYKLSTLVHVIHMVYKSLCMAMRANHLISQCTFSD